MKKILLSILVLMMAFTISPQAEEVVAGPSFPLDTQHLPMVSENYVLIDSDTGVIVAGRNVDKKVHPASITKAITAITALELLEDTDLNDLMVISPTIFPIDKIASIAFFNPDDKFTYDDVFYGLALPSGADAANALSYDLTGSAEGLAEDMNKLAARIGMRNSHFVNTTGLDHVDHLTTVEDLANGIRYALNNEKFRKYYTAVRHTSAKSRMHPNGIEWQDNTLVNAETLGYKQVKGAKSGYTELAERSVSLLLEIDGKEYIYVSTNASKSSPKTITLSDAMRLVKEIEDNFTRTELFIKDTPIQTKTIFGLNKAFKVQYDHSELFYLNKDQSADKITYELEGLPKLAFKGIAKGTEVGTLNIKHDEEIIFTAPIVAQEDMGLSIIMMILMAALAILIVGLLGTLIAMIYFALARKRNRSRRRRSMRR